MPVVNQSIDPAQVPSDSDASNSNIAAILQTIQGRNQQVQQGLQGTQSTGNPVAQAQGSSGATSGSADPMSVPIAPVAPRAQAPAWQVGAQQNGRNAQKRADMSALMNNIQGLVKTAATNSNAKNLSVATNNWSRLMTAMQNPDNPQNKAIIQSILGDPKVLKQMSKALNIDWLNPSKGADNVYRQAFNTAMQKHQLKTGALEKLKDMLTGQQPDVALNPQQSKTLATQMEARFPQQLPSSQDMDQRLKYQVYQKIVNDPKGINDALGNMSDTEKQILGIGPSANAQLKAQVDAQIAQMKADEQKAELDLKSKDFEENLQNNITRRQQSQAQFGQNQIRLQQLAQQNFILKTKSLQQQLTNAKTATDRAAIAKQIADTGRSQMKMNAFKDQLASIDRQETTLTAQERAVMTANKTQPGGLGGIFEKDTDITDAGQAQIATIQAQLKTLDSQRADVLKQQYAYVDSLNQSLNSMTSGTASTATPVAKQTAPTTTSSDANPFR